MRPTLGPKEKLSRRVGQNLFLKGERSFSQKHAIIRNPSLPGQRRNARRRGMSDYGEHLLEKQKVRYSYGISESQMRKYYEGALKASGNTAEVLLQKLESRLDNSVFRAGFVISRSIARHLVSHGHFRVNNKRVNLPSYSVKPGDIISVNNNSLNLQNFNNLSDFLKKHTLPKWIQLNKEKSEVKIIALPTVEDNQDQFNLQLVIEFYAR